MYGHATQYDQYITDKGLVIMDKQEPEYISTKEAMDILKVNSTQAVRYLMGQYPSDLPGFNFGSEEQPRWMLRRADVVRFQNEREQDN